MRVHNTYIVEKLRRFRKFINSNSKAGTTYFKITQETRSYSKEIQLEFPRQNKLNLREEHP